jgi:methylmalonyl-CoA mutase C-terminal domain/subunit
MGDREKIRVLLAKPGLDGHNIGIRIVSRALRDAGMEVIYSGMKVTPEEIVHSALQEDVDIIGLSILSGAHMTITRKVLKLLREKGLDDIKVCLGGIVPEKDALILKKEGVAEVFGPETPTEEIVRFFRECTKRPNQDIPGKAGSDG